MYAPRAPDRGAEPLQESRQNRARVRAPPPVLRCGVRFFTNNCCVRWETWIRTELTACRGVCVCVCSECGNRNQDADHADDADVDDDDALDEPEVGLVDQ